MGARGRPYPGVAPPAIHGTPRWADAGWSGVRGPEKPTAHKPCRGYHCRFLAVILSTAKNLLFLRVIQRESTFFHSTMAPRFRGGDAAEGYAAPRIPPLTPSFPRKRESIGLSLDFPGPLFRGVLFDEFFPHAGDVCVQRPAGQHVLAGKHAGHPPGDVFGVLDVVRGSA